MLSWERPGTGDIIIVVQWNSLRQYGHVNKWRKWLGEKCIDCEVEDIRSRDRPRRTWSKVVEKLRALPLDQSGGLSHCALSFLYILSFSYYPQRCTQRRSLSRCLSAVAAAKPACIDPAASLIACVDHAEPVTHGICIPADGSVCCRHGHISELISGVHSSRLPHPTTKQGVCRGAY